MEELSSSSLPAAGIANAVCVFGGAFFVAGAARAGRRSRRCGIRALRATAVMERPFQTDELAFAAGEEVTVLAPPAFAGEQGTVVEPVSGGSSFAVRFGSGSVFHILKENLRGASEAPSAAAAAPGAPAPAQERPAHDPKLSWAPASYFDLDQLTSKGPRRDADKGSPCCASRVLFKGKQSSVGSWSCTPGGFPVVCRGTTEVFHILSGEGTLTDASDGEVHYWRGGDTVVLPKGWSGRWDISKAIHKIWVVNNHPDDLSEEDQSKAVVAHSEEFHWSKLRPLGARKADWGTPEHFNATTWKVGSTYVGSWACTEGGFLGTANRPTTEFFYVLEGIAFLTGIDGVARRVTAGDTIVLPKGWSGRWDVVKPIRKVFGVISE